MSEYTTRRKMTKSMSRTTHTLMTKTALATALAGCFFLTTAPIATAATPVVINANMSESAINTNAVNAPDYSNLTVTSGASITTTGNGSSAIAAGTFATITHNGTITVSGDTTGMPDLTNAHFADGILALENSSITNNGNVKTSGNSSYAIYAREGSTILNSGTVKTIGKNANGLMGENGVTISNSGIVNTSGDGSYGMRGKDNAILTNTGIISTTGLSEQDPFETQSTNTATAMQGGNKAALINSGTLHTTGEGASGMAAGDQSMLHNTGNITVEGDSHIDSTPYLFADGMMGGAKSFLINDGSIKTSGKSVYGLYGGTASRLINRGNIQTEGLYSDGLSSEDSAFLFNTGNIHVSGTAASGMYGRSGSLLINTGTILAEGNGSETHPVDGQLHYSAGIAVTGQSSAVANTGTILATGAAAQGIHIEGSDHAIYNTGTIRANNGNGIAVSGTGNRLFNTGLIETGENGYELELSPLANGGASDARITSWATRLDKQNVFHVTNGTRLDISDAHLIVRAPSNASSLNKAIAITNMITSDTTGAVTGAIGSVSSVMPMLNVRLTGNELASQTITMNVNARAGYSQQANATAVRNAQNRFWLSNRTISDTLTSASYAPSSDWHTFGQSYHMSAGASGDVVSSSDSVGMLLGATKKTGSQWLFGFHAGIETTDTNAGTAGVKSDSTSWLAGLHGSYTITENAFLHGQLTGMVSKTDYDFSMTGDTASENRTEYGLFANVTGGYHFKINETHTLTPEIGLAYLWLKNPSMNVNWKNADNRYMNVNAASDSYDALFATAALRWKGDWAVQDIHVKPNMAIGVRQTLTDGKISSDMAFLGNRYGSTITDDKTVGTVDAGVTLTQKNMSMSLRYNGNFGSDTHNNTVWGEFGYTF